MIRQITDRIINFTVKVHPPECVWGENRYLDQLGATAHLSPSFTTDDLEIFNWIKDNKLEIHVKIDFYKRIKQVEFKYKEDAMAFKLRWL